MTVGRWMVLCPLGGGVLRWGGAAEGEFVVELCVWLVRHSGCRLSGLNVFRLAVRDCT